MKTSTVQHDHGEPEQPVGADDIAISVRSLTKKYRIFSHPGDRIKQALTFGRVRFHREFTALQDVSFEIKKGEAVGIIGRNGSGKSTLLQLICGILKPTSGTVQTNGRISALLELGSGFNPEFTGRENVYFQGAVVGFTQQQMDERIGDIIAFADIGEFIDQPVRTYSSGMFVRLAFAVAIAAEPDILVIDEALAVGDIQFQSRCFQRMQDIRKHGVTIFFVSHSIDQVTQLCNRAILIDEGEILAMGAPKLIVGYYQKLLFAPSERRGEIRDHLRPSTFCGPEGTGEARNSPMEEPDQTTKPHTNPDMLESYDPSLAPRNTIAYESHGAFIESPLITTLSGKRVNIVLNGNTYRYEYVVRFKQSIKNVRFGMLIKTSHGIELGGASSAATLADSIPAVPDGTTVRVEFQFNCTLNPGVYFLNAGVTGIVNGSELILHRLLDAEAFRVVSSCISTATSIIDFGCKTNLHINPPTTP